jgi:hypothetical protein
LAPLRVIRASGKGHCKNQDTPDVFEKIRRKEEVIITFHKQSIKKLLNRKNWILKGDNQMKKGRNIIFTVCAIAFFFMGAAIAESQDILAAEIGSSGLDGITSFGPLTVGADETIRVSVFNDNPVLSAAYVIQIVDVVTGAIIEERNTGLVQPLSGVVEDHSPASLHTIALVMIRGLVDSNGDGIADDDMGLDIASTELMNMVTGQIRTIPGIRVNHPGDSITYDPDLPETVTFTGLE